MTRGLHILGAAGDGLKGQTVTARIESVDVEKFKRTIGQHGSAIDVAIDFADWQPKAAIDAAIPLIKQELAKIGVSATITAGAGATRGPSEFWGGLAVGGVLGMSVLVIWKLGERLLGG